MANAARYEYKESPGIPVVFRSRTYGCASDALSAYISDYEGRQVAGACAKYEQEMLSLFCPQYQPTARATGKPSLGVTRHSKSKRETELEKLVQQAYDQLRRLKESKKVEDSLNASTRLIERIDRDRLPSPTRSAILNGAASSRQSMESVATDVLLDAKPVDFSAPYSQQRQNHGNKSLLESLDLVNGDAGDNGHNFSMANGPYQLRGMNELMSSIGRENHEPLSRGTVSNNDMTVNDLFTSSHGAPFAADTSRRTQLSSSLRKEDLLSSSQLGRIKSKLASDFPYTSGIDTNPLAKSWDGSLNGSRLNDNSISDRLRHGLQNPNVSRSVASKKLGENSTLTDSHNRNNHSQTQDSVHKQSSFSQKQKPMARNPSKPVDTQKKLKTMKASTSRPPPVVSALPTYLSNGYPMQGELPNNGQVNSSVTSSATDHSSSIISGHLLKAKRQKGLSTKVFSTPKRGVADPPLSTNSKQLRFDLNHGCNSRDVSGHSKSLDLSNIEKVSVEKPDFTFGRREIIGILKPPSPDKRRASSRVSFTTDDLLHADASGLEALERQPRSRSLPRPANPRDLNGSYSEYSPSHYYTLQANQSGANTSHRLSRLDTTRQGDTSTTTGTKESKYKYFLEGLMREIDESNSSIVTGVSQGTGQITPQASIRLPPTGQGGEPGFLSRIKELLGSPPPAVSQFLDKSDLPHQSGVSEDSTQHEESLSTEAVLEGDRSWEQGLPFKPPKEVVAVEPKSKNRFEKFMDDCMAEAEGQDKTLTGKSQPGALETLKNMMFKMQSFSEPSPDETLDESAPAMPLDESIDKLLSPETKRLLSKSYSTQPGGPCLAKAMEHLTKLKDLVENKGDDAS